MSIAKENRLRAAALLGAIIVSCTVIVGWLTDSYALVQLSPSLAPMQFNTALAFITLGMSAALACRGQHQALALGLASFTVLIAGASLLQYPLHMNFGIDSLFVEPFVTVKTSHPGRMSPNTALAHLMTAASVMIYLRARCTWLLLIASALSMASFALASASLVGAGFGIDSAYGWFDFTHMALHTAVLHCTIAIAHWSLIYRQLKIEQPSAYSWQSIAVLVGGGSISAILFLISHSAQAEALRTKVERDGELEAALLQRNLDSSLMVLKAVERFIAGSETVTPSEFETFIAPLMAQENAIMSLDWSPRVTHNQRLAQEAAQGAATNYTMLNSENGLILRSAAPVYFPVTLTHPSGLDQDALGFDHYSDPRRDWAMDQAASTGEARASDLLHLFRLAKVRLSPEDFLIFMPSYVGDASISNLSDLHSAQDPRLKGFVTMAIRLSQFVSAPHPEGLDTGLHGTIFMTRGDQVHKLFSPASDQRPSGKRFASSHPLSMAGTELWVEYVPTSGYLEKNRASTPMVVLLFSMLLTLLTYAYLSSLMKRQSELETGKAEAESLAEELAITRDQALEAVQAKSAFLASMSHEIRTPMNAILGMAELLEQTNLTDEQANYVGRFNRAGEHLLSIINDILDLAKIERGLVELETIPFDLEELLHGIAELMAPKASSRGLEMHIRLAPDIQRALRGDPTRLRQVLVNLIGNAIKFTAVGEVTIQVEADTTPGHEGWLLFSITDTGIGIAEDKQAHIFGHFTQADDTTTRKFGGTGLGLGISHHLVDLLGGELKVKSQLGAGSTFSFSLHFELGELGAEEAGTKATLQGKRGLVIDDHETNRLILREILKHEGVEVSEASNAAGGLIAWIEAQIQGAPFDFVVVDGWMPGGDGFQFIEEANKRSAKSVNAIVMLSSDFRPGGKRRSRELGVTQSLVKPVSRRILLEAITAAMDERAVEEEVIEVKPEPVKVDKPLKVLVVEDNEDNQMLLQAYLASTGHTVVLANNGELAVQSVKANDFDVVFMDMQMPIMDGYNATRNVRTWEAETERPRTYIVALTANTLPEDRDLCLAAGCDDYLSKPIRKATFLAALDNIAA